MARTPRRVTCSNEPEALVGTGLDSWTLEAEKRELLAATRQTSGGEVLARREARFLRLDGSLRVGGFSVARLSSVESGESVASAGTSHRVVVVIRDITDEVSFRESLVEAERRWQVRSEEDAERRKEAEGTRSRVEAGLLLLINALPDMVLVHRNGRIVHVNDVAVRMLGHEGPADLIGRHILDIKHPDERALVAERVRRIAEGSERLPPRVSRVRARDGAYRDVEFVGLRITFDGEPAILALGRDLTERKRLDAQLALGERLVAMGTLAAGVGHEVNNPLTSVMGNLECLAEELSRWASFVPADRLRDATAMLAECRAGADRVREVVAGLRHLSHARESRPAAVDVRCSVEQAIAVTAHEVRCRAQLVKHYGQTPEVLADDARMARVFINVLVNAAQAIPEGRADQNEIAVVTETDAEGRARISIRDTGIGIAPEHLHRIFKPFFTIKPVGVGSGLGLSIAHDIVTSLQGTIDVASVVGKGTTVTLTFPASPTHGRAEALPLPGRGRVIRSLARRILTQEHEVTLAASGAEARSLPKVAPGST